MTTCMRGSCDSSRSTNGNFMCGSPTVPSGYTMLGQLPYDSYYSKFMLFSYRPEAEAVNMQSYNCAERVARPYAAYPPMAHRNQIEELYLPRFSRSWTGCRRG